MDEFGDYDKIFIAIKSVSVILYFLITVIIYWK